VNLLTELKSRRKLLHQSCPVSRVVYDGAFLCSKKINSQNYAVTRRFDEICQKLEIEQSRDVQFVTLAEASPG